MTTHTRLRGRHIAVRLRLLWPRGRDGVAGQFVRYFIAGGLTATTYSCLYLALATWVFPGSRAVLAVPMAFVPTIILGFCLHSAWSFGGYGVRDHSGRQYAKFLVVHSAGSVLNMGFTFLLTAYLGAPVWTPLVPSITITPVASFLLQRKWVFA